MRRSVGLGLLVLASVAVLAGCASQGGVTPPTTSSAPVDLREKKPELEIADAAQKCVVEIDTVLFLEPPGIHGRDGFWAHYDPELYNASVVDGEWHFEFLPTHEVMAKATCHTDGTDVVSMTRREFEDAMIGYTYEHYQEDLVTE